MTHELRKHQENNVSFKYSSSQFCTIQVEDKVLQPENSWKFGNKKRRQKTAVSKSTHKKRRKRRESPKSQSKLLVWKCNLFEHTWSNILLDTHKEALTKKLKIKSQPPQQTCQIWSRCILVITTYGCYSQHAARIRPDHVWINPASRIWYSSIFSNKGMDHTFQNWPRSDLDGLVRVWPNASGLVASQCAEIIEPGFWQDTPNLLPVSDFQIRLHSSIDVLGHIMQNQPGSELVLLCQVLAK